MKTKVTYKITNGEELDFETKASVQEQIHYLRDEARRENSRILDGGMIHNAAGQVIYSIDFHKFAMKKRVARKIERNVEIKNARLEDGTMYVQTGGMDCDCCQYVGSPHPIEANKVAWNQYEDEVYEWAEGPVWARIVQPEELQKARKAAGSRDLAMEAYEDGHAHVVYT